MPRFTADCVLPDGRATAVDLDSATERAALSLLETRGHTVVAIRAAAAEFHSERPKRRGRGRRRALLDFTHQMTAVSESGIPVLAGLKAVGEQTEHEDYRKALRRIASRVEGGESLSESLAAESELFPPIYAKTLAAGEASGQTAEVFGSLARYLEDEAETRAAVRSALLYPALVVGCLALATLVMLVFVFPKFQEMFAKFEADLPLPTRIVMTTSEILRYHPLELLAGLAVLVVAFRAACRDPRVRRFVDERKLRVPIFGPLMISSYMHRMVELLGLLTRSALPIVQALRVTAESMTNESVRHDVRQMIRSVEGGKTLGEAFAEARWLTPLVKRMLAVGEQAGRTDQIFDYLGRYYLQETRRTVKTLSTLIEPVLVAGLAAVVLFFALSIFLPMFRVLRLVSSG